MCEEKKSTPVPCTLLKVSAGAGRDYAEGGTGNDYDMKNKSLWHEAANDARYETSERIAA